MSLVDFYGNYTPSKPGARTITEARPLYCGRRMVTATVYQDRTDGATKLAIFVGTRMLTDMPLPEEINDAYQVNPYVVQYVIDAAHEEALQANHEYDMAQDARVANDDTERRIMNGDDYEVIDLYQDGDYIAITRDGFRYFGEIIGQFEHTHYGVTIRMYRVKVGEIVHYATANEMSHARRRDA